MKAPQVISLCYTGFVALVTAITPQDIEIYARIFMYISAGFLSIVTLYFVIKNKGKKG